MYFLFELAGQRHMPTPITHLCFAFALLFSLWGPEVWPCKASAPGTPLVVGSGSDHVQTGYNGIPVYARPCSGLPCWDS